MSRIGFLRPTTTPTGSALAAALRLLFSIPDLILIARSAISDPFHEPQIHASATMRCYRSPPSKSPHFILARMPHTRTLPRIRGSCAQPRRRQIPRGQRSPPSELARPSRCTPVVSLARAPAPSVSPAVSPCACPTVPALASRPPPIHPIPLANETWAETKRVSPRSQRHSGTFLRASVQTPHHAL
ncbi:hypothetical protein B0H17DRAFT_1198191 [Mycena rosella]|uniref:Uncharacterized protein n=1 Tax=Mycena rosella TaxID=1033263 RepID=A0AAD7GNM1_MYCRO|nr:hypothetical protein B0H17DRAFT_1198191 [Mycena rosella]